MSRSRIPAVFVALSLAAAPALTAQAAVPTQAPLTAAQEARLFSFGHTYTRWLLEGKADSLAGGFEPKALEGMGGVDGIRQQIATLAEHAGTETDLVVEKLNRRKGLPQFWHEGNFSGLTSDALVIRWLLDVDSGKIVGAGLGTKNSTPAPDN